MKETLRKLDGFGFVQWFGLVCSACVSAITCFIGGVLVYFTYGKDNYEWTGAVAMSFFYLSLLTGAYIGVRIYVKRQP